MWGWRRPEPEHTPHRGQAACTHACTHACTRTHTETYLLLQPDQQRGREMPPVPTPAPGRKQSPASTNTETRRLKPCHTARAHQENRGKHGARRTHRSKHACTRKHALSAKLTCNRDGSAARTVPPGAGHGDGTNVRHNSPQLREDLGETQALQHACVRTHTHTHTHPAGSQEDPQRSVHYTPGGGHRTMLLNLSVLEAAPHCEPRARS